MARKTFKGVINLDIRDSRPDWGPFTLPTPPKGAPNVLVVLYDETGFAAWSPFGGAIQMPTLQKLADRWLMYSQWHTTALCSPTRSTFLTGRNHHLNGCSCITEAAQGFPGWSGRIPPECATIGQVLQDNGYSTFWLGKNHNVPEQDVASGASRSEWRLQKGFDRYYGFLGGETNQWYPDLVEDDQDAWELFHVDVDRSESTDLARQHPDQVKQLVDAWFEEAQKNLVLPLDDRSPRELLNVERPSEEAPRERYVYHPGTSPVPEGVAVNVRGRSYKILADIEIETPECSGVIFAHGSRFGGHALFIKVRKLFYVYNFLGLKPEQKFVSPPLEPGKYTLGMEFIRDRTGEHGEALGHMNLYVNEEVVAHGDMRTQSGKFTLSGDGLCIGRDSGDAVSEEYQTPGTFTGGTIQFVAVTVEKGQYIDLEKIAAAALAVD